MDFKEPQTKNVHPWAKGLQSVAHGVLNPPASAGGESSIWSTFFGAKNMNLQREIEDNYGFWICKNDQSLNNFSYCRGHFMPCSRRAGGRSIWVQECDTKYIIGLWGGYVYVCSNRDDALQVICSLISGEKRMTDILETSPAKEIDIHYLLSEEVQSIETFVSSNMLYDKQILLPINDVKDFLLQSQCQWHCW